MAANKENLFLVAWLASMLGVSPLSAHAQVPGLLSYQGRVLVGGSLFSGVGQFKFALINADGSQIYWSNSPDNNGDGQPDLSVPVSVAGGLFTLILGDTNLPAMAELPLAVFTNSTVYLRVWFDDGTVHGVQQLVPDQRVASTAYAMMAGNIADGSITPAKLAPNTASAINATLSARVDALTVQLNSLSNQLSSSELTAASSSAQDASLTGAGFQVFSVVPAPAWQGGSASAAPSARSAHGGAWSGQQLLIWGGHLGIAGDSGSGAAYRPDLDEWQPISPVGAPSARSQHSAIWSGTELMVWGGTSGGSYVNTGARFNPTTQTWTPLPVTNAPSGRIGHIALWTGAGMLVWGGRNNGGTLNNGGLYNPSSSMWSSLPLPNAPAARSDAAAVWAGNRLLVWGGQNEQGILNSGAQLGFNNGAPTVWFALSAISAPSGRTGHTAVWTGQRLLIWGGKNNTGLLADGASYDPVANAWSPLPTANAPTSRTGHGAVWTGQEMIIFGGESTAGTVGDGAAYNPATSQWRPLSGLGNPTPRSGASTVWSGTELIVFGGLSNGQPIAALQLLNPQPAWYLYRKP